ncbi:MAG TPA: DUF992 domain-containing protein [Caulobacteraceae bacterium]|nr:DUF992 domain-containing protein [Caulobacteraceae bacterium]
MKRTLLIGLAAIASAAIATSVSADPSGVNAGVLSCDVSSGWGFVFGSSKDMNCTFSPAGGGDTQRYTGTINKYGVDIGYTRGGVMVWAVFAPGTLAPGALAGNFGGVTAGAAVGVGANAHALVGGSNNSVSLQPLSIEGQTGLNVAAGVAGVTLTAVK